LNHTKTSLYTYVLKDIQKNKIKIETMTLMPGLRACVLGRQYLIALVNKTLKIFCTKYADNRIVNETIN
jgi:hypothetical protein